MHFAPEIAVLVSSYQRPRHLLRVLHSIAAQKDVDRSFEVIVTDDGSEDETHDLVQQFAESVTFRVGLTTHPHETYQLARCRNEGVRASSAPYLLFLDGDCLIPADHLRQHLDRKRGGVVQAGYCALLNEEISSQIDVEAVRNGDFVWRAQPSELRKLAKMDRKARFYEWIHHPSKPKMFGGNVGIHRCDYEDINGYDEDFQGWGCEDDDLRIRLRQAGKKIRSILRWTRTYHLWHLPGSTTPDEWKSGRNVTRLTRKNIPTRCQRGLHDAQSVKRAA
jgi:glycosyltransferase involved in cell wall biosynthesis